MRTSPLNALPVVLVAFLALRPVVRLSPKTVSLPTRSCLVRQRLLKVRPRLWALGMKMGLEAAFAEVNKAGGVKGRKLELRMDFHRGVGRQRSRIFDPGVGVPANP